MLLVKQLLKRLKLLQIHEILFFVFLFLLPLQIRILYFPESAYTSWYFNYHEAMFIYLADIVLFVCFTSYLIFDYRSFKPNKRTNWLILGILGLIVLALFRVKHLGLGIYETIKWLEMFFIFIYIQQVFTSRLYYIYGTLLVFIAGVLQSIIAILQFHKQHSLGLNWLGEYIAPLGTSGLSTVSHETEKIVRAYGTMPHPNVLGGFLVVALVFGLYLLNETKTKTQTCFVSCGTILVTLGVFVSFSRTAWVAAALCYICFTIYYWIRGTKQLITIIAIIGIVSCGTIGLFGSEYLISRISNVDTQSITGRTDFNTMTGEIIKTNPWLGTGPGNYIATLKEMFHVEPWQYQPAHNIFLVFAAQFGILALALFIKLLTILLGPVRSISRETISFTCFTAATVIILMGQFDHYFLTIQQGRLIFFVVLGLLAALPNLKKDEKINV